MQGIVCLQRRRGKALCAGSGSADASGTSSVWGKHSRGIADCADRHHASKQHVLLAVLLLDIHRRYSAVSVWPLVAGSYQSPRQPCCAKLLRLGRNTGARLLEELAAAAVKCGFMMHVWQHCRAQGSSCRHTSASAHARRAADKIVYTSKLSAAPRAGTQGGAAPDETTAAHASLRLRDPLHDSSNNVRSRPFGLGALLSPHSAPTHAHTAEHVPASQVRAGPSSCPQKQRPPWPHARVLQCITGLSTANGSTTTVPAQHWRQQAASRTVLCYCQLVLSGVAALLAPPIPACS